MVDEELELSFADLLARPLIERDITLNCVSNEVGGPYIGTARWLGVPLAPLLRELGIQPGADQIVARSVRGHDDRHAASRRSSTAATRCSASA